MGIDNEMVRLVTLNEEKENLMKKNKNYVKTDLPNDYDFQFENDMMINDEDTIERLRDQRLVQRNPMKYCQDRCVGSGYCEVFEDMFDFTPEEVLKFCTECVLSEEEEPCDVPEMFYVDENGVEMAP